MTAIFAALLIGVAQVHMAEKPGEISGTIDPTNMMRDYLRAYMVDMFERRSESLEHMPTVEDCAAHQQSMREFFLRQIGGLPEQTPLNAEVRDRIEKDGYTIEKVIYESRPQFHVTALFYLPKGDGPFPGVLVPCGHDPNGKAAEAYQRACIFLATNGFAVLCYDPIGQGERVQLFDEEGKQKYSSTIEHTLVSVGAIPLGWGASTYRIWDGLRSIDYLCSRPEIDPTRIGCTGNSGGGTMTSYLMALDDRIVCAAPSCYIGSLKDLILVDGPHDAEQCIAGQLAFGMDHGDYIMMRAPKPTLVCCATRDFFPINGTWDTYRMAKRFYTKMGYPERLEIAEADAEHGFTPLLRQAMVRWMRRWLQGIDDEVVEGDYTVLTDEEALVTPTGKVLDLEGAKSVWDLNAAYQTTLEKARTERWAEFSKEEATSLVKSTAMLPDMDNLPDIVVERGEARRVGGLSLTEIWIEVDNGIALPGVIYEPESIRNSDVLFLHGEGRQAAIASGEVENLANDGHRVFAVDVRGIGETQSDWSHGPSWDAAVGPAYKSVMLSYMLARPYLSVRVEDILCCVAMLQHGNGGKPVRLIATGEMGPPALHAAVVAPDAFESVRISHSLRAWKDVVEAVEPKNQFVNVIHGSLRAYDLPDLVNLAPTDKIQVTDSTNAK